MTSIKGSYTWEHRPGLIKQIVKTLRPVKGGWVNRIGLRNPGIQHISFNDKDAYYSIVGMNENEWSNFIDYLPKELKLEINIGCPNEWAACFNPNHLQRYLAKFSDIILKVPACVTIDDIAKYHDSGVRKLHMCNSLPTAQGGVSGAQLKQVTLPLIEQVKQKFPNLMIIAGGGIYHLNDALDYAKAGAEGFSLSTVWFNPFKAIKLLNEIKKMIQFNDEQRSRYAV